MKLAPFEMKLAPKTKLAPLMKLTPFKMKLAPRTKLDHEAANVRCDGDAAVEIPK
jgi:hypothetical protein